MSFKKIPLAIGLLLAVNTAASQATLTLSHNGLGVYDSALNVTWTQDGNLLGTLETANYVTKSNLVTAIINANGGVIHDTPNYYDGSYQNYDGANGRAYSGVYQLTSADFYDNGAVTWWGAQAFVHYLNTIDYDGSSHWTLPTTPNNVASIGSNQTSSQLGELFYNELGGTAYSASGSIPTGPFSNATGGWSGTEYTGALNSIYQNDPQMAWGFSFYDGTQNPVYKVSIGIAWPVAPGNLGVSSVPLPGAFWLFAPVLAGFIGLQRRK